MVSTLFITFNVYMNDYGLLGDVRGRLIPVYTNERTTKYLFSYNYIPSNFEGLVLGASVANNLNTKDVKQYKIYNGSLSGANYTELSLIAENVLAQGKLKFIILCLYPYSAQSHGRRSSFMNPHEYWESLGSQATFDLYRNKILILLGAKELKRDEYGYHDRNLNKNIDSKKEISGVVKTYIEKGYNSVIDKIAYEDLAKIVALSRAKDVKIIAYFHPHPYDIYIIKKSSFNEFRDKMRLLFKERDLLLDFNSDQYRPFRKDYSNFADHTHLSPKGAQFILKEIINRLNLESKQQTNQNYQ
jgi:hypothetical protein